MRTAAVRLLVTSFFFFLEALVHYNIGATGSAWVTRFPPFEELVTIVVSIGVCAGLSELAVIGIDRFCGSKEKGRATLEEARGGRRGRKGRKASKKRK
jgi:hypothetical protein